MLIDNIKIKVAGGTGGNGIVAFSKEMMCSGPTGGDGGDGGNVVLVGVEDIGAFKKFRYQKEFIAQKGQHGKGSSRTGANGKDLILEVPIGTVIHGIDKEIVKIGETIVLAKGGRGGKGNASFKSSRNVSPKQFTNGLPGEAKEVVLELKLIADIGLVGLPNTGKSSLLNYLTNAKSKVSNYQFTTLEPHLGVYKNLILADIPGIIEGASTGKGLGIKFLRHIERTKIIFHLISLDSSDFVNDYNIIRKELESYNKLLTQKPEYIIATKSDLVDNNIISKFKNKFKDSIVISIYDKNEELFSLLAKISKDKNV
ncbi:MAG: GTPase Obg [Parcubacteria group bacterium ADurb.Bin247]|jgi:GTP-binding protein|nr:MAG: GTPase Obg [Parcubacteria group bacterium ADurb.Bin247]HQB18659.1 GTPase ObgE [Candidatus Pacearchaeota archaeon]